VSLNVKFRVRVAGLVVGVAVAAGTTAATGATSTFDVIRTPQQQAPFQMSAASSSDVWTVTQPFLGGNGSPLDPVAAHGMAPHGRNRHCRRPSTA